MSTNSSVPYLRTSRDFSDVNELPITLDKMYIDIANTVNTRTIGIFPTNRRVVTGESWFVQSNQRQQTLRQVYPFGAIASGMEINIPHNITSFIQFTRIYGTVITNVPDYRPLPYVDPITLTTGMAILVGLGTIPPNVGIPCIRIVLGATAVPVTSGVAVLEWMSAT